MIARRGTRSGAVRLENVLVDMAAEAAASGPWAVLAARRERALDAQGPSAAAKAAHTQHMRQLRQRVRAESAQALRLARKALRAEK